MDIKSYNRQVSCDISGGTYSQEIVLTPTSDEMSSIEGSLTAQDAEAAMSKIALSHALPMNVLVPGVHVEVNPQKTLTFPDGSEPHMRILGWDWEERCYDKFCDEGAEQ